MKKNYTVVLAFLLVFCWTPVQAQIQWAGAHLVDLDAGTLTPGVPISSWANPGTIGGTFDTVAGNLNVETITPISNPITVVTMVEDNLLRASGGLPTELQGGNKSFTLEFWYSNPDLDGEREYIFGTHGGYTAPYVYFVSCTIRVLSSDSGIQYVEWAQVPDPGWIHQVFTYDATTGDWKLYRNSEIDREGTGPGSHRLEHWSGRRPDDHRRILLGRGQHHSG